MLNRIRLSLLSALLFVLAPILNDDMKGISLGRTLFFLFTLVVCGLMWKHFDLLNGISIRAVILVLAIFAVLAMYCLGNKKHVRDLIYLALVKAPGNPISDQMIATVEKDASAGEKTDSAS